MTSSTLKKFLLTPVVLSATVFGALTLPLALLGQQPVTIQLQKEPVFQGQLRDVATPYLGLATAVSVGAGLASVAVTGWRLSTRKSSQVEAQLSAIAQHLQEKEAQLEALKLSESRLCAAGLSAFIDEEVPLEQINKPKAESLGVPQVVELKVITEQPVEAQPVVMSAVTAQEAARQFASAQAYLGYAQVKATVKPEHQAAALPTSEIEQLHAQLQEIMAQMASVQATLAVTKSAETHEVKQPEQTQPKVVKSWSVQEMASSLGVRI